MKTYTLLEACRMLQHPLPVSHKDLVDLAGTCVRAKITTNIEDSGLWQEARGEATRE